MKHQGVYKILNCITGDCYVGSSARVSGIESRWKDHVNLLRRNKHHSPILQRAWSKYGEENFKFEIIEECDPSQCLIREQFYLDTLFPKYNILKKAGNCLGRRASDETRKKLKNRSYDWMRGDKNWNRDPDRKEFLRENFKKINIRQYVTDDTLKKIAESRRGIPRSKQTKYKISKSLVGVKKTSEHIEKMKNGAKRLFGKDNHFFGKKHSDETRMLISNGVKGKTKGLMVGEKNPMFGKDHTQENKHIMSIKSMEFWNGDVGMEMRRKRSQMLVGRTNKFALRGVRHPRYNPTIYTFHNNVLNIEFIGTMFDFRKKYKLSGDICYLLPGKRKRYKQYKGWEITNNETTKK